MRSIEHLCRGLPVGDAVVDRSDVDRSAFSLAGTPAFAALRITSAARRASVAPRPSKSIPAPWSLDNTLQNRSLLAVMRAPAGAADVTTTVVSAASATRTAVVHPAFVDMRAPSSSFEVSFGSVRDERRGSEHRRGAGGSRDLVDAIEVDRSVFTVGGRRAGIPVEGLGSAGYVERQQPRDGRQDGERVRVHPAAPATWHRR